MNDAASPGQPPRATDWDRYYDRPARAAAITRRFTAAALVRQMRRWAAPRPAIIELGGADSCFFDAVQSSLRPREYHVVDNNQLGLDRLRARVGRRDDVQLHCQNVLQMELDRTFDVAFSVGLVEHFPPAETARAVAAHFDLLRPGGIAILSFPTPTWLYRAARRLAERCGAWRFPDERPLEFDEVAAVAAGRGRLLARKTLWPIVLTQCLTVWQEAAP